MTSEIGNIEQIGTQDSAEPAVFSSVKRDHTERKSPGSQYGVGESGIDTGEMSA